MSRYRITVRSEDVELRGYIDGDLETVLGPFSEAMKPYGLVIASEAEDNYNPFKRWVEMVDTPPLQRQLLSPELLAMPLTQKEADDFMAALEEGRE